MLLNIVFKRSVGMVELTALGEKPEMIDLKLNESVSGIKLVLRGPTRDAEHQNEEERQLPDMQHGFPYAEDWQEANDPKQVANSIFGLD
jgi:hypothetical protein